MSTQPAETESTEDFSGPNFVLGLAVATAMAFAWWGLMDRLQISYSGRAQDAGLSQQLVTLIRNTFPNGFWMGTLLLQKQTRKPLRFRISIAVKGALAGGLFYLTIGAARILLESAFGETYGELIYSGLGGGIIACGLSTAWTVVHENHTDSFDLRRYLAALARLSRAGVTAIVIWTLDGVSVGLAFSLALMHVDNWWLFALIPWAFTVWGLWLGKPAIIFDPARRRNAIRTVISVVAIVGPILVMALNVQLGLMVAVSVILLYAVITLRK